MWSAWLLGLGLDLATTIARAKQPVAIFPRRKITTGNGAPTRLGDSSRKARGGRGWESRSLEHKGSTPIAPNQSTLGTGAARREESPEASRSRAVFRMSREVGP
jgi:hypothetical protein